MPRLLPAIALVGTLAPIASRGADRMYTFVDAAGVVHYSNVPEDDRYQVIPGLYVEPRGGGAASRRRGGEPPLLLRRTSEFDEHIRAAAEKYGLAPSLLKAVMAVESNFDPGAISVKGASGLMQLMPATARDLFVDDLFDPAQNIEGGARYLRQLHDEFGGDLERVLAAYNAGPERVRRSGRVIPDIPETQAYVRKVLALFERFRNE